jgi:hypothetical protein
MDTIKNRITFQQEEFRKAAAVRKPLDAKEYCEGIVAGLGLASLLIPDWMKNMDLDKPNQVSLPEYVYVPYRIGMPPDGKAGCWFTHTVKPDSIKHLLDLQHIHGVVFFHHETCKEYVNELNKNHRFEE